LPSTLPAHPLTFIYTKVPEYFLVNTIPHSDSRFHANRGKARQEEMPEALASKGLARSSLTDAGKKFEMIEYFREEERLLHLRKA
jgi:hypothetical protein